MSPAPSGCSSGNQGATSPAAVDVTRQTISAIERQRYDPSIELAFKLADHFGYRTESLFDPELNSGAPGDGM